MSLLRHFKELTSFAVEDSEYRKGREDMSGQTFDWQCPFCDRGATITQESVFRGSIKLPREEHEPPNIDTELSCTVTCCPNPKCKKYTLSAAPFKSETHVQLLANGRSRVQVSLPQISHTWQLIPSSTAKTLPDYIPQQIRNDYQEACSIRNLSPKASATLSRRCLQGMIRDFWEIKKVG